jgi:large subunit ribosomal protein L13
MAYLKLTKDTYSAKPADIQRDWFVVDATDQVLGRLASKIAQVLRGKNKPIFTPSMDTGDHVIVINASRVRVTGGKESKKIYYHHSGYPGGLKETPYEVMIERQPEQVMIMAVRGMLPRNRLGRAMLKKLHVYAGAEHPHVSQEPQTLEFEG